MLTNTDKFREPAIFFKDHGTYTLFPKTSKNYRNFWKEEKRRCIEGYTAPDGDYITGYFYFYLNYCPIYKIIPKLDSKGKPLINEKGDIIGDRIKSFPEFWDGDYDYFNYLDSCEKNGKHGAVLKTRGRGYSFKGASMLNRNFFLIPGSKSYVIADQSSFLGGEDGILSKAWEQMSHINDHTAWAKKMEFHNTDDHKRASYKWTVNGVVQEKGYMSDIIGVTLKNDPQRARGKRGKLILFEEAGKFPSLLQAWQIARPSVEQGGVTFGLLVCFGTGGTEGADFDGLSELFDSPEGYNIKGVPNTWDEGMEHTKCGFFMPEYMNLAGYYDKDGNSDIQGALKAIKADREQVLKNTRDTSAYKRHVAEKPINTIEARMKLSGNMFPTIDLNGVLAKLELDPKYEASLFKGKFELDVDGTVLFKENPEARILYNFPHRKEDNLNAPVILYQLPVRMNDGSVPTGLYIAGTDPYNSDESTGPSLGSTFVMNKLTNQIVAEYTARPETLDDYYEQVRRLLLFYNARCLYEKSTQGMYSHFEKYRSVHLLCPEPTIIKDIISNPTPSKTLGIRMPTPIKRWGEGLIKSWLLDIQDPELMTRNLHKIRSIGLLKELVKYDPDPKKNFDRVMALMCMLYEAREEMNFKPQLEETKVFIPAHRRGHLGRFFQKPPLQEPR